MPALSNAVIKECDNESFNAEMPYCNKVIGDLLRSSSAESKITAFIVQQIGDVWSSNKGIHYWIGERDMLLLGLPGHFGRCLRTNTKSQQLHSSLLYFVDHRIH